jgi:hypothetical protein
VDKYFLIVLFSHDKAHILTYPYLLEREPGGTKILPLDENEALELGLTLVNEKNETEIEEVLNYLSELALKYAKEGQENDTKRLIEYIKSIGKLRMRH